MEAVGETAPLEVQWRSWVGFNDTQTTAHHGTSVNRGENRPTTSPKTAPAFLGKAADAKKAKAEADYVYSH